MTGSQGNELSRYADRHFITKPELVDVLTKLRSLRGRAEQHFSRTYLRSPGPGAAA